MKFDIIDFSNMEPTFKKISIFKDKSRCCFPLDLKKNVDKKNCCIVRNKQQKWANKSFILIIALCNNLK